MEGTTIVLGAIPLCYLYKPQVGLTVGSVLTLVQVAVVGVLAFA